MMTEKRWLEVWMFFQNCKKSDLRCLISSAQEKLAEMEKEEKGEQNEKL